MNGPVQSSAMLLTWPVLVNVVQSVVRLMIHSLKLIHLHMMCTLENSYYNLGLHKFVLILYCPISVIIL